MNTWIDRLKTSFGNLSDREQKLVLAMGVVFGIFVLGAPLLLMHTRNLELEDQNGELRGTLQQIAIKGPRLAQLSQERREARARYLNKTPALGSFLESEAGKQGLSVKEFTDQPQKTVGHYVRRNVRISLPGVELTPTLNLMSNIVQSNYPVAVEQIQMEHFQSGDKFNVKLGVLTYDRVKRSSSASAKGGK